MSKQNLHSVDTISLLEKSGRHSVTNTNLSTQASLPKRYKVILLVSGLLAFVAVLAAMVAVFIAVRTSLQYESNWSESGAQHRGDPHIDMETKVQLLKEV